MRASRLASYLRAASRAADRHPYPDPGDGPAPPPPLTAVYVCQKVAALRHGARADEASDSVADPSDSAESVFAGDVPLRILVAQAGGGKSTLLRLRLADAGARGPSEYHRSGRATSAAPVPVLVQATALAAEPVLSEALAKATTEELGPLGLREPLTADFFSRRPDPRVPWLVLVDGLDEVAQQGDRTALLERLALAAEQQPCVYRFVVTTRPLPTAELARLGSRTAHFSRLLPFTMHDVRAYARACFAGLPHPAIHRNEFMTGLQMSGLDALARTPLIASILCRLYLADPARPLPEGRTAAYRSFVELLYEQNAHKDIRGTHDSAIRVLKDQYQIPRDNRAAERAAQEVRDRLPELIDLLAHERIHGNTAPASEILSVHVPARRPERVTRTRWTSFLGDLLRPTGLLVQRGNDFDFLHRTLLEYHAARHATRDRRARVELLPEVFPYHHEPPPMDASYLGFLLDGLLDADDHTATAATWSLERLTGGRNPAICRFLTEQAHLRTHLPRTAAGHLARFAADTALDEWDRVRAAWALSRLEGHDGEAAALLAASAADPTLGGARRVKAAGLLARIGGHGDEAAVLLAGFLTDPSLKDEDRVYAAWALGQRDDRTADAVAFLVSFVKDSTRKRADRVRALTDLSGTEGHTQAVAGAFLAFAADAAVPMSDRVRAAAHVAGLDAPAARDAVGVLTAYAMDTTLKPSDRMQAAGRLTRLDTPAARDAAGLLAAFAMDTALDVYDRVHAAGRLVHLDAHAPDAVDLLVRFATDTGLEDWERLEAASTLLQRTGDEHATALFTALATDSALDDLDRMDAIKRLAELAPYKDLARTLYAALATDTALPGRQRAHAAIHLVDLGGDRAGTMRLLTALIADSAVPDRLREYIARELERLRTK
ncbi:NACHT domain-containing protein [Streptomyces sp. PA5.6]|uniref:NACHT domain-containing protein n=1 Tax=Streptomyces sp. PA5.6 TaxID=3035651 RepID=UPI0039046EBA